MTTTVATEETDDDDHDDESSGDCECLCGDAALPLAHFAAFRLEARARKQYERHRTPGTVPADGVRMVMVFAAVTAVIAWIAFVLGFVAGRWTSSPAHAPPTQGPNTPRHTTPSTTSPERTTPTSPTRHPTTATERTTPTSPTRHPTTATERTPPSTPGRTAWIAPLSGKAFHVVRGCHGLRNATMLEQSSMSAAMSAGKKPCNICMPMM